MYGIFINSLREKFKDKYTKRGAVYSILGLLGLSYELIFGQPAEPLVVIFYSVIIGIGLILVFFLNDQASRFSTKK